LIDVFEFQIASPEGNCVGAAFGDQSSLDAAETSQGDGCAIVGVKAFELDLALCSLLCGG